MKAFVGALLAVLVVGCSGTRPATLGARGGRLAPCPSTPNCVSSQAPKADAEHYVEPLRYEGPVDVAMARLVTAVLGLARAEVITREPRYLHVEVTSFLFRFVDDLELLFPEDEPGVIHCRSASRLGRSDMGVNRGRIEELRELFGAAE